ncbi:hypothetical protein AX769_03580 [Frondihabitans sp. PAMC 28766]|nr:hypothetical protein AX769_03580 [Frondihabitans sp. PAMC 28766]
MIAVSSIALAGCSAATNATTSNATTGTGASAAAGKVEPLVLYAAEAYDVNMGKAFTAKTGIPVKVVDDSTGPLLTKVAAEKNNPQWSMLWVDGDTAFASLDKQKELLDYTPSATYTSVGKTLVPSDHSYVPTGTTAVAALIYNSAATTKVPTSYSDLLTSAYSGKVGMNDPSQSGPTYPLIAGLMNQMGGQSKGVAAGEAYLTKLKSNGLKVYPTNGDTLHALETKQIDYGLIQSSAAVGETLKVKATGTYAPKIVYLPKTTLLPGVIGIDKAIDATQQAEAKKFVDYALSPAGQQVMQKADTAGDSLFWPVVQGSTKLAALPALPTTYQQLDPYFWGPLQSQVVTWFDSNIK